MGDVYERRVSDHYRSTRQTGDRQWSLTQGQVGTSPDGIEWRSTLDIWRTASSQKLARAWVDDVHLDLPKDQAWRW